MKSNITPGIKSKMDRNLHNQKNHPLEIIKRKIYEYFGNEFETFDNFNPIVSTEDNFDKLRIEKDHPSRSLSDTYYVNEKTVLRTHTSAHQNELLQKGIKKFLVTGDVYRKDEINSTHYPVFHQTEGICIFENGEDAKVELKKILGGLIEHLFPGCTYRFNDDYFPFTEPSFEVEVEFNDDWLEVLGCGVVHQEIMNNCDLGDKTGWAFGLGLERLAMILFKIPDIRYFWTTDKRFLKQFESGDVVIFQSYSKHPPCPKDISFWTSESFNYNEFCEIIREVGGDLVEEISLLDDFIHPTSQKTSKCYRIIYRSPDRSLTNEEIDSLQQKIREQIVTQLNVEIR